jgi:PadR family transcriptional regulator, regulatory protein PadR
MMGLRDIELAAIQAHILHHAAQQHIYGQWMMEELARHGYRLSYGTLYPTLHRMLEDGLLVREEVREGSQVRKYYTATPAGRETLAQTRQRIRELYRELVEEAGEDHGDGEAE